LLRSARYGRGDSRRTLGAKRLHVRAFDGDDKNVPRGRQAGAGVPPELQGHWQTYVVRRMHVPRSARISREHAYAARGSASPLRVHNDGVVEAYKAFHQTEATPVVLGDLDVGPVGQRWGESLHDVQAHRIVRQKRISQPEYQCPQMLTADGSQRGASHICVSVCF